MLMDLIRKVRDAVTGKHIADALHRVDRMDQRNREVKEELKEMQERTDRLRELVKDMRGPP